MALIEVNDLTKRFGAVKALDEVSFAVEGGEIFGIVGESGAGKTTLGRIMLKLLQPSHGEVTYRDGFSRRDYQIVFQNPYTSLNPRMKVGSILKEPLKVHGVKKDISELLNEVGLDAGFAGKFPHELSGGERQRVGIARAIGIGPKFVLLDEPVSSLDITVSSGILKLLKRLKAEKGLTYVFIAHDLAVIRYMCDRVGVMRNGRMIETGSVGDVFRSPQHSYTKLLLESVPVLFGQVQGH